MAKVPKQLRLIVKCIEVRESIDAQGDVILAEAYRSFETYVVECPEDLHYRLKNSGTPPGLCWEVIGAEPIV